MSQPENGSAATNQVIVAAVAFGEAQEQKFGEFMSQRTRGCVKGIRVCGKGEGSSMESPHYDMHARSLFPVASSHPAAKKHLSVPAGLRQYTVPRRAVHRS